MTVHILENPRVLAKLRAELKAALPNPNEPLSIKDIEQLPYLSAVITEGMRLAMGTSQRQTRINPNEVMTFNDADKQWSIPPGVSKQPQSPFLDTPLLKPDRKFSNQPPPDTCRHERAPHPSEPRHLCQPYGISPGALYREPTAEAQPDDLLAGIPAVPRHEPSVRRDLSNPVADLAQVRQQEGSWGGWVVGVVRDGSERCGYGV